VPPSSLIRPTCSFVLASRSPRRKALLERLGLSFRVEGSPADETVPGSPDPAPFARRVAAKKVGPVATAHPEALVLAADTVVAHGDALLGKPESPAHARRMLRRLSDSTHHVHTGVALAHAASGRQVDTVATTEVTFAPLSDREIAAYVQTGSPMDKAGGYGIQDHTGPLLVERIAGDYYTVVGLPLRRLYEVLRGTFSDLLAS